jgi:DNA polymerase-3 subunit epsilon
MKNKSKRYVMRDFAAIDFETANDNPASVCKLGLVIVCAGKMETKRDFSVRPFPNYYTDKATRVHGLNYAKTCNAPIFPEVWMKIMLLIGNLPLVAHNSAFEKRCLRMAHEAYGMICPEHESFCTCNTARRALGKAVSDHKLGTVAAYFGITNKHPHDALSDAITCAKIAKKFGDILFFERKKQKRR